MSSRVAQGVHALLEKTNSPDADFRYMALSDLMAEARKDTLALLDDRTETAMVQRVLDLVRDPNGEVKNMSIKCLGTLVKSTRENQLRLIIDKLVEYVSSKEEELRDIASLGLKTVMAEISSESGQAISAADKLVPRLLAQVSDPTASQESLIDSLDVLADYFARFANAPANDANMQRNALKSIVAMLNNNRAAVRKRAIQALSALAAFAISDVFTKLSESIAVALSSSDKELVKANVQLLGSLARYSPRRLGRRLPEFLPRIVTLLSNAQDDDELREACLQTLDSVVLRCPSEVTPFTLQIVDLSVTLLKHDPNYAGDDFSDDEADEDLLDDDDDEFLNNDDYSDDEDVSWKVRRASVKVLTAVIATRSELLSNLMSTIAPALVARFSEREESVRDDVLLAFASLLRQVRLYGGVPQATEVIQRHSPGGLKRKWDIHESTAAGQAIDEGTPYAQVIALKATLCKALAKACVAKSITTRVASYVVLRELITTLGGGLDEQIGLLVGQTEKALKGADTSSGPSTNVKTEILSFLLLLFRHHQARFFDGHLEQLVPFIASVITDRLHRESIEGFRVAAQLVEALRTPYDPKRAGLYQEAIMTLYKATVARLTRSDSDQEIKEIGIATLGDQISFAGDDLSSTFNESLALLLGWLENETTRLAAIKAIAQVALSRVCQGDQVDSFAEKALGGVLPMLTKNSRPLRIAAFETLNALLLRLQTHLTEEVAGKIVKEVEVVAKQESNLNLLPAALQAIGLLLSADRAKGSALDGLLHAVLTLVRSPLLQGASLDAVLRFLQQAANSAPSDAPKLLAALEQSRSQEGNGQPASMHAISVSAQCTAAIVKAVPTLTEGLVTQAKSAFASAQSRATSRDGQEDVKIFSQLKLIGELARFTNFSDDGELLKFVLHFYSSPSEEVQAAAAFALGNMAIGNLQVFLPIIEGQMKEEKQLFLALNALKELIAHGSTDQLATVASRIWSPLLHICSSQDEAIGNMAAECLARLTLNEPASYLTQLQSRVHDPKPSTRASVAAVIRFTLTDSAGSFDEQLKPIIVNFLSLVQDESLDVRKPAVFAFNAAAHNRPSLIRDHLQVLLPMLYRETLPRQELLRKVSMGPFTITTDDGLDLRKNAFETMYTLLDTCFSKINLVEYIDRVIAGMRDEDGIKVLCSLMLVRLAALAPTQVVQRLDDVVEPITSTLKVKLKEQATKQDVEKSAELQRSLFRAMVALDKVSHHVSAPKFRALVRDAKDSSALYREVEASFSQTTIAGPYDGGQSAMDLDDV